MTVVIKRNREKINKAICSMDMHIVLRRNYGQEGQGLGSLQRCAMSWKQKKISMGVPYRLLCVRR